MSLPACATEPPVGTSWTLAGGRWPAGVITFGSAAAAIATRAKRAATRASECIDDRRLTLGSVLALRDMLLDFYTALQIHMHQFSYSPLS